MNIGGTLILFIFSFLWCETNRTEHKPGTYTTFLKAQFSIEWNFPSNGISNEKNGESIRFRLSWKNIDFIKFQFVPHFRFAITAYLLSYINCSVTHDFVCIQSSIRQSFRCAHTHLMGIRMRINHSILETYKSTSNESNAAKMGSIFSWY